MSPPLDPISDRRNLRPVHIAVSRSVSPWWRHQWDVAAAFLTGAVLGGAAVWAFDHLW